MGHTDVEGPDVWGAAYTNGEWVREPGTNGIFVGGSEALDRGDGTGRLMLRQRCACRARLWYDAETKRVACARLLDPPPINRGFLP